MTKEERLHLMLRGLPEGYCPEHFKVAAEVLDKLAGELGRRGFQFDEDPTWPYHLLVPGEGGRYISFFCGGFRRVIEVQQLKRDGTVDTRFREESFATPRGAVNYLRRRE